MARTQISTFFDLVFALTKKILLIAVARHWRSTLFRSLILPVPYLLLLLYIKDFLGYNSTYGIGTPAPVRSLSDALPGSKKLVIVKPPGLGDDVDHVVNTLVAPLQSNKQVVQLADQNDLLAACRQDIYGDTDCFAAVVFNDSPLTSGKNAIWNYTIRANTRANGNPFDALSHNNQEDKIYLPLQVAIENAVTNSTLIPNEFMYTSISQSAGDQLQRQQYQLVVIRSYGVAFFLTFSSSIYHLIGMITSERESGVTQLIDAMGGRPAARIISFILAFDIIYLPSWVFFGVLFWYQLFTTSSFAVSFFWQILTGLAVTSASVLPAMFFSRSQISGVVGVVAFLLLALGASILDENLPASATVGVLSFLLPSMNYIFMLNYMCRYEGQGLKTDLIRAPPFSKSEPSVSRIPAIAFWAFLVLQIVWYPLLAAYIERWFHGTGYRYRVVRSAAESADSQIGVQATALTKIYFPNWRQRWFPWKEATATVAVQDLNLTVRKGQLLCLLGANGSGKTTTVDMIAGLRKPTSGSIHVDGSMSRLGICPQRNVLWEELTVAEHLTIWRGIKQSSEDKTRLNDLIDRCDLTMKKHARVSSLSGGQKRKLQLACMFVGTAGGICLLDEVTSGLDPLSRRVIWSIILSERSTRTQILTTHFLDEAEVLADHVAIISKGTLRCEGSAVELKMRLGSGYRLQIPRTLPSNNGNLPTNRAQGFNVVDVPDSATAAEVLSQLQGVDDSDVTVHAPTIEDVFLRVADEANTSRGADLAVNELHPVAEERLEKEHEALASASEISLWRQIQVLLSKRLRVLFHTFWPYLFVVAIPIAATPPLRAIISHYKIPTCLDTSADVHPVQPINIPYVALLSPVQMLVGPPSINQSLFNVISSFPIGQGVNLQNFSNMFVFEQTLNNFQHRVAAQSTTLVPGAIFMDSNSSSPTYAYLGDGLNALPAMLVQNLWTQLRTGIPIVAYFTFFNSQISPSAGASTGYVSYVCLALAVYPALFALYPTYEKTRGVRALQYSNGIQPFPLWCAHFLFDFSFVLISAVICTAVIAAEATYWFQVGYMFPVLLLYGLSATLFGYLVSVVAKSQLGAFAMAAGTQGVMFVISIVVFTVIETFDPAAQVQTALDAAQFSLNLFFPIANVFRAMLVGLNVDVIDCREGNVHVSTGGSIFAYGSPILYLIVQICFYLWLLVWLESAHTFPSLPGPRRRPTNANRENIITEAEVVDEKARVEQDDSDLLRLLHLSKSFGQNLAVDDVSFGVSEGEILGLLGPNGAGKTTVVNMVRGELVPDSGEIFLRGTDIVKKRRAGYKYVGVCPQFDALDMMTVREHLVFYARAKGVTTVNRDVDLVVQKVGLQLYEETAASKLSGGNKRKLSLAIALIGNPSILLLDEPSSSLDAVAKRVLWKTLAEISIGRSVLLTTHSMEEATAIASRCAIMSRRILTIGSTSFLRRKFGSAYHVHIVLKSAPGSSDAEMEAVGKWAKDTFPGARMDPHGNQQGQIKFEVPIGANVAPAADDEMAQRDAITAAAPSARAAVAEASDRSGRGKRNVVADLFALLERHKVELGLAHYSVSATTLNDVFLNVVRQNNVREEGSESP